MPQTPRIAALIPCHNEAVAIGKVVADFRAALPQATWLRLLVWTVIGFLIYFFYGFRHSALRRGGR